jgi:hypothetical protein
VALLVPLRDIGNNGFLSFLLSALEPFLSNNDVTSNLIAIAEELEMIGWGRDFLSLHLIFLLIIKIVIVSS